MNTYEFSVKKTLIGTFTVEAENSHNAYLKVREYARNIMLVNNMSPWTQQVVQPTLIHTTEEDG
jgi:hypothetical protein